MCVAFMVMIVIVTFMVVGSLGRGRLKVVFEGIVRTQRFAFPALRCAVASISLVFSRGSG
jgi:hypothetical protein